MRRKIITFIFSLFICVNLKAQEGWFWQNPLPQGNKLYDIFCFDENNVIMIGALGTVMKSIDGGGHWEVQYYSGGTEKSLYSVHFIDAHNGWATGDDGTILKTTNGGKTWSAQISNTTMPLYSIYFVNSDIGWAVGYSTILKTTNGGNDWIAPKVELKESLNSVFFVNDSTGWVVGGFYSSGMWGTHLIMKTNNGGDTWIIQHETGPHSNILYSVFFTNVDTGWAVGSDGTILKTIDSGLTWNPQTSGTTRPLFSTWFIYANT